MPRAHREGFDAALSAVTAGDVDVLVVWKLDRLSRRGIGQVGQVLDDLERAGGRLVSVKDGVDTAQPQGRVVIALLAEFARAESETMGMRVRSAKEAHRAAGRWLCGKPPYGYAIGPDRHLIRDEPAATIMREAVEDILGGKSLRTVCRGFNQRGIPTARGGLWRMNTLSAALGNPALAGLTPARHVKPDGTRAAGHPAPYRDQDTGEPVSCLAPGVDPIVSRSRQLRMQELLRSRLNHYTSSGRLAPIRQPSTSLASGGLSRCAGCGRALVTFGHSYRCRKTDADPNADCPSPASVAVAALDRALTGAWLQRLADETQGTRLRIEVAKMWLPQRRSKELLAWSAAELEVAEARSSLLEADEAYYIRHDLDLDRYQRVCTKLRARLDLAAANQRRLVQPATSTDPLLDAALVLKRWNAATVLEQRHLVRLALAEIRVSKALRRGGPFEAAERLAYRWLT